MIVKELIEHLKMLDENLLVLKETDSRHFELYKSDIEIAYYKKNGVYTKVEYERDIDLDEHSEIINGYKKCIVI